jgi:hypothetical protein
MYPWVKEYIAYGIQMKQIILDLIEVLQLYKYYTNIEFISRTFRQYAHAYTGRIIIKHTIQSNGQCQYYH